MASRLDVSRPCASVIYVLPILGGICRPGVGSARKPRLSLVPSFLNNQKIFGADLGKLHSLAYEGSRLFLHPHIQHHDPNTSYSDPYLTTLHPTLAIDYFPSRLLGRLSK